jgi:hypothetical protein
MVDMLPEIFFLYARYCVTHPCGRWKLAKLRIELFIIHLFVILLMEKGHLLTADFVHKFFLVATLFCATLVEFLAYRHSANLTAMKVRSVHCGTAASKACQVQVS